MKRIRNTQAYTLTNVLLVPCKNCFLTVLAPHKHTHTVQPQQKALVFAVVVGLFVGRIEENKEGRGRMCVVFGKGDKCSIDYEWFSWRVY